MNVTYEKKNAMTFIGYHTVIRPEEAYQKCPEFWDREYAAKYARLWQTMKPENDVERAILENGIGMYAICADSEGSSAFDLLAGEDSVEPVDSRWTVLKTLKDNNKK